MNEGVAAIPTSEQSVMVELTAQESSPGKMLAASREKKALSIADVAQQLKLGLKQIKALEADDYAALPGHTFIRGFIRNYSKLLEIDPTPLLAIFEQRVPSEEANVVLPANTRAAFPEQGKTYGKKRLYALVAIVIITMGLALDYIWHGATSSLTPDVKSITPDARTSPVAKVPPEPSVTKLTEAITTVPAVEISKTPTEDKTIPIAQSQENSRPLGRRRRIILNFEGDAWVEIKNKNDKILFSRLNLAGSEQIVDAVPPLYLVIGNASSVRVTYRDKPIDLKPHTRTDVARVTLE